MFMFSEIEYNNNLLSINNTVVCETSITYDHSYNKLDPGSSCNHVILFLFRSLSLLPTGRRRRT